MVRHIFSSVPAAGMLGAWLPMVSSALAATTESAARQAAPQFHQVIVDKRPPGNPWTKLAGDFNGDGKLDVAIGGQNGPLVWYANPGWLKVQVAERGWSTVGGAAGDVDGDGDVDIVPGAQVWFENPRTKGDPAKTDWRPHRISVVGTHDVALVDLDRDGKPDLVGRDQSSFGHNAGNQIHFWRQQGLEAWNHHAVDCPHGEGLAVGDLDRDGDLDVVIGGRWLENDGRVNGAWQQHTFTTNWAWADAKVALGDLNGDSFLDVVLAPAELQGQRYRLAWYEAFRQTTQPDWQEHVVEVSVEAVTHGLAVADMDGDTQPDIVTARMHQGAPPQELSVYLNAGKGSGWRKVVVSESGSHDILVADLNGDGRPDILGANHGGPRQAIEMWLNEPPPRPASGPLRLQPTNPRYFTDGNLFNGANTINGINVDRNRNRLGEEFFSLDDAEVVKIQKAYVEKMVETVNDLDNILWEICNEAPADAMPWQYELLRHLKAYERQKPKKHVVLLSPGGWKPGGWSLHPETKLLESDADCIATANGWINQENPTVYQIREPVIFDLDHVAPGNHDPSLVWKAFTRGYHFSLYDHPFEQPQNETRAWQTVRANIRQTRLLSLRVRDMARMQPRSDLASSGYCLANQGQEYVVFAPQHEAFEVRGLRAGRTYRYEWFATREPSAPGAGSIVAGANLHRFQPPQQGAVLFLTLAEP